MKILYIFEVLLLIDLTNNSPIQDPEEIGGDYEGDILLTLETLNRGIGERNPFARWPNGIVPYEISSEYDGYDQAKIISGMRRLERVVSLNPNSASFCIRFRPKTDDGKYFISIKNGSGCSSYVGRVFKGGQIVTLQMKSYCVDREATIMHEFMHGREHNFNKYSLDTTDTLGLSYDYNSVMHYSKTIFSKNGLPTISPKDPNAWIGQRNALSAIDIEEIRRYYNCI